MILFDPRAIIKCKEVSKLSNKYADVVISLTSHPKRVNDTKTTLISLLNGSVLPKEILFNLPYISLKGDEYVIPQWLVEMSEQYPIIKINRCDIDYGPGTKIIPTLIKYRDYPEQKIIYVDNDQIYPINFLKNFLRDYTDENVVLARAGYDVKFFQEYLCKSKSFAKCFSNKYVFLSIILILFLIFFAYKKKLNTGIFLALNLVVLGFIFYCRFYNFKSGKRDIIMGVKGVLVKPRFFKLEELLDFSQYPEGVIYHDDIYLSGHLKNNGINRIVKNDISGFPVLEANHFKYALRTTSNDDESNRCNGVSSFGDW